MEASVLIDWRNPKLHDESRIKQWSACADHEQRLSDFLALRGFLLGRRPLD